MNHLSLNLGALLALLVAGCDLGGLDGTGTEVERCDTKPIDSVDIGEVSIDGSDLIIEASFGGGCEDHEFQLCYNEILESEPVQIPLRLIHDGNGDGCEAYLTEELTFDLSPLDDEINGSAILSVNEVSAGEYTP